MSVPVLLPLALLMVSLNDHAEFESSNDRASVIILPSATPLARDRLIEKVVSRASSLRSGKASAGSVVGSLMKYRGFDFDNGSYLTIYYSDEKPVASKSACKITGKSTRHSAFFSAMKWCAQMLGLAEPSGPIDPPANDEGGSLLRARDHSVPPRPVS